MAGDPWDCVHIHHGGHLIEASMSNSTSVVIVDGGE